MESNTESEEIPDTEVITTEQGMFSALTLILIGDNMAVSEESKMRWQSQDWKDLTSIQNKWYAHQDIMTITGMMNHDQFIDHVERYRKHDKEMSGMFKQE